MTSILLNKDNFTQPIHMQLPRKLKTIFDLFSPFFKGILNFEHFDKKMTVEPYASPKLRTPKDVVTQMSKMTCFKTPFDKPHGKRSQTLVKSARQQLYHV